MDGTNLIEYLPQFLREYRELAAICDTESPELDAAADQMKKLLDKLFIESTDLNGLSRLEEIAGTASGIHLSEAERKSALYAAYNLDTVYTYRKLIEMLAAIQGNNSFSVHVLNCNIILLDMNLESRAQYDAINKMLYAVIPCNMSIIWGNVYKRRTHMYMSNFTHSDLSERFH